MKKFLTLKTLNLIHNSRYGRHKLVLGAVFLVLTLLLLTGYMMRTSATTATVRPNGEVTAGWAVLGGSDDATCSGPGGHCSRVDEATLNSADYIGTGTANTAGGEVAEFTMQNPNLVTTPTVSQVKVYFNAASVACVNTAPACDRLIVSISMDNGATYSATQTFTMTTTQTTYSATFSGSWSGINGLQVRISRQVVLSTGPGTANDDDVRLYQMYADFEYVGSTTMQQAAYRWFNNSTDAQVAFDTDGVVQVNPTSAADAAYVSAKDTEYIYIAGYEGNSGNDWRIEKRKLSDGSLVTGFASGGVLSVSPGASDDRPEALLIDGDYLYIGGWQSIAAGNSQWRLEKRNKTTGALCSNTTNCAVGAFNTTGIYNFNFGSIDDKLYDIQIDGDYIFLTGYSGIGAGNADWRVEKRNKTTGALCSNTTNCVVGAFDTDGIIDTSASARSDVANDSKVSNGYLYIFGDDEAVASGDTQIRIEKRNAVTGALCSDTTVCPEGVFDGDGIMLNNSVAAATDGPGAESLNIESGYLYYSNQTTNATAVSLWKHNSITGAVCSSIGNCSVGAFDTDGKVEFNYGVTPLTFVSLKLNGADLYWSGHDRSVDGGFSRWNIRKLNATTGAMVTAFGTNGEVFSNPSGGHDEVRDVEIDATHIYIVGYDYVEGNFQWRIEKRKLDTGSLADNSAPITIGSPLVAQDTAVTNVSRGAQLRLRMLVHIGADNLLAGPGALKLQYAAKSGTCDTSFSGETYRDVKSTTAVAFYNNSSFANGAGISTTANDPSHTAHTVVNQTYSESNNIDIASDVPLGQDGQWDVSLTVPSDAPLNDYCLRLVRSSDGSVLDSYTVIPELRMAPSVSAINPNIGPASGGTPFMLTGTFGPNTTVTIGGISATNVFIVDSNTLIGTTPAGSNGAQNVVVTNGSSSVTLTAGFTYSSQQKSFSKQLTADFSLGTLTNVRAGTIEIGNGAFQWKDFTPSASGGALATGTYYYSVTALDRNGNETTRSIQTPGVPVAGPSGSVLLRWKHVAGAYGYKIYRTTTSETYGASSYLVTLGTTSSSTANETVDYLDIDTNTISGQPPASNLTNTGVYLPRGTVPSSGLGTVSTGPTIVGTAANTAGQGAHFLERPDGTYLLIQGGNTANTSIYNPTTNSFSAGPSVGGTLDWGGHSFKLPDGRYYVMIGNSTTAVYYDPVANTFSAAPSTTGTVLWGGNTIPLENGNFLIIHGANATSTSIYNVASNTVSAGPATTAVTYVGSHSIKRPNGTWLVVHGGGTTTSVYNESSNTFSAGPSFTGSCNSGCGSLQMPDGRWLIIGGAATATTNIYNPWANTMVAGPTAPGAMHDGRNAFELPDGRWLIIRANSASGTATNGTYIYNPYTNSFSTGPNLSATASAETPWLQRPDGTYIIVHGNATATTSLYDAGWLTTGSYESEAVRPDQSTVLRQLSWTNSADSGLTVEYRAATTREGLSSASYGAVTNGATLGIGGKTWVQWRVTFTRGVAANGTAWSGNTPGVWGARAAIGYRSHKEPSIQSLTTVYDFIPTANLMRHSKYFRPTEQLQPFTTQ